MRSSIFLLFFIFSQTTWSQEAPSMVKDSLPAIDQQLEIEKDSISPAIEKINKKVIDSLTIQDKRKKSKPKDSTAKRYIPYIKPMDLVTVEDYQILHFDWLFLKNRMGDFEIEQIGLLPIKKG